jgi:hypothetical protein
MAETFRAVLKSFDAGTYRATVQIEGSRSAFASSVPVSRAIPSAEMVAGRACVVVFLNPEDATDSMLLGVST